MEVNIDFSVFISSPTESEAYGNISGTLVLPAIPSSGDELSFFFSPRKKMFPKIEGVRWVLSIETVVFLVGHDKVCLSLEDVVIKTKSEAEVLVDYFVDGFGLYFDCFLDVELESVD
jgi:hypothetical protein